MFRFVLFLVKIQWRDRIVTSAFVVGITFQTAVLSAAILVNSSSSAVALLSATRSAFFTCIAIVLLSSMSAVQNEFRYATISRVVLGKVSFPALLGIRSFAIAVVSSPAILIPYAAAAVKFPILVTWHNVVLVGMVYICLIVMAHASTVVLCYFRNPGAAVPWLRLLILYVGVVLYPWPALYELSLMTPPGLVLRFSAQPDTGGTREVVEFLASCACWSLLTWLGFGRSLARRVESNSLVGSEAR